MKKITIFSSALVALAMLASCQKEQLIETPATTTGVTEFTATIEQPTKTAIASDGKITWTAGDEITVTDAASKSAVYVAASSGASTKFTPKDEKTTVGSGPYTATYGDITKQTYSENGANCPLTAAETSSTTFHFSSPYAVLKITAKSSGAEAIKTVVVNYGNKNSVLDCGDGVSLTPGGADFYVAVYPATEAAALSVSFYTADKMATRGRKSPVLLASKNLLPVTFESLEWGGIPTFKAVYNTTNTTLTFYYDVEDHSGEGITVYEDGTDNYLFDDNKDEGSKWGYQDARKNITSIVIDASVKYYPFLKSTTYMFYNMYNATSIVGAEYLDVSNVTDMNFMFSYFGRETQDFNAIPNVSEWNTVNVTDMGFMFNEYGYKSTSLVKVPDVSGWNTVNVTKIDGMFYRYGFSSTSLVEVPDVSGWGTGNVTDMNSMFYEYGKNSTALAIVPDVSGWNTGNVTSMGSMFYEYGYSSTALAIVPDVSGWNTGNVTSMGSMFRSYGYSSTALAIVPNVSGWKTGNVTKMGNMFRSYGYSSTALAIVPDVSGWGTGNVTDISYFFTDYGHNSKIISCVLDLSEWNLGKAKTCAQVFNFNPQTFNVKIPAKTGDLSNTTSNWYCASSTNRISPPSGYSFTLASN